MQCPSCEKEIGGSEPFCPFCGANLEFTFCGHCGSSRAEGPAPSKLDRFVGFFLLTTFAGWITFAWLQGHDQHTLNAMIASAGELKKEGSEFLATAPEKAAELSASAQEAASTALTETEEMLAEATTAISGESSLEEGPGEESEVSAVPVILPIKKEEIEVRPGTYQLLSEKELVFTDRRTVDLRVRITPALPREERVAIAKALLNPKALADPNAIFVLSLFEAEPRGGLLSEEEESFAGKFLWMNPEKVLEEPPEVYERVEGNLFVRW
jgi:hypothetical protein